MCLVKLWLDRGKLGVAWQDSVYTREHKNSGEILKYQSERGWEENRLHSVQLTGRAATREERNMGIQRAAQTAQIIHRNTLNIHTFRGNI